MNKWNSNYCLVWSKSSGGWVVSDELSSAGGKGKSRNAVSRTISRVACAMLVAGGMLASMPEDASALTATNGLLTAGLCTGTATSITAAYTGSCTATLTDSITLSNTGKISLVGTTAMTGAVAVDALATGVTITNSGVVEAVNRLGAINIAGASSGTTIINQAGASIQNTVTAARSAAVIAYNFAFPAIATISSIDNSGTISVSNNRSTSSSVSATAIRALNTNLTGSLVNQSTGTISAAVTLSGLSSSLSVYAAAIALKNINVGGSLSNQGSISATASNHATDTSSSASITAVGINHSSLLGTLTNDGSITATVNNTGNVTTNSSMSLTARAISGNTLAVGGTLTNNGAITATATNTGTNFSSSMDIRVKGVNYWSSISGTLTNSSTGVISATGSNNGVGTSETVFAGGVRTNILDGTITNDGTITASASNAGTATWRVSAAGVNITSNLAATGVLNNHGTISAGGTGTANATFVGVKLGRAAGGTINNSGIIKATPNTLGSTVFSLKESFSNVAGGTFNNLAGGVMQGNISTVSTAFHINNAGLIDLPDDAVISSVAGNVTQLAGGVLRIGASSSVSYANLTVGGIADLSASGAIDVNVNPANTLAVGNVLTNVVSVGLVGTLTVNRATVTVTDNSAAFDFTASVNLAGTGIDLTVIAATGADTQLPVISRTGAAVVNVAQGATYIDLGATANDNVDGVITGSIVTANTVNTAIIGSNTITYNVTDAAGNAAVTVARTVNVVVDTIPPIITLNGANPITIAQNAIFTDPGFTAIDNVDGDVSANVVTGGTFVNTNTIGTFTITYDVSDASGNAATQVTRTVNVVAAATAAASSGGGGGCTINPDASFDPTLSLMLLFVAGFLLRKRKDA